MYRFPPLAECRRRFAEDFGQSLDHLWGDDQEDWDTEDEPAESFPMGSGGKAGCPTSARGVSYLCP
jgi:hypothetical protein